MQCRNAFCSFISTIKIIIKSVAGPNVTSSAIFNIVFSIATANKVTLRKTDINWKLKKKNC